MRICLVINEDTVIGGQNLIYSLINVEVRKSHHQPVLAKRGRQGKAYAGLVGKLVAERAKAKGIEKVVFDRNGFLYHGRVKAVSAGAREVTLLGQNVNSYGAKEGLCSFPELLERVNAIEGLARIRFTTSHPKDLTEGLIRSFARLAKLCPHIHLPVQSGSNRILARMNRRYTRDHYLDNVSKLRNSCPGIAITSDMIVGFPGETQADFEATLELVREVQFDGLFAFTYSDRPHAPSTRFPEKVPARDQSERLQTLLDLQHGITFARNRTLTGSVQEVLAEGFSKQQASRGRPERAQVQWTGRSPGNKVVNFDGGAGTAGDREVRAGQLVSVRIERALAHSLWGVLDGGEPAGGRPRREVEHAA